MSSSFGFGAARAVRMLAAVLAWLALVELLAAVFLSPTGRWADSMIGLVRFSEYGRSIEGKIAQKLDGRREPGPRDVLRAGWLDPTEWAAMPAQAEPGRRLIAGYGQSFLFRAMDELVKQDASVRVRRVGGPAAPLSHSVAALLLDLPSHQADAVVIGVLASSLTAIDNLSMVGRTFEAPAPFTFPAWDPVSQSLVRPQFSRYAEFETAFRGRTPQWQSFRAQALSREPGLDAFVFDATIWDHLLVGRLVRRGWLNHLPSNRSTGLRDSQRQSALKFLELAASATRTRGVPLILMLFHDAGQTGVLDDLLRDRARELGVTVISSSDLFASTDPVNFMADGHFTPKNDAKLAAALAEALSAPPVR